MHMGSWGINRLQRHRRRWRTEKPKASGNSFCSIPCGERFAMAHVIATATAYAAAAYAAAAAAATAAAAITAAPPPVT